MNELSIFGDGFKEVNGEEMVSHLTLSKLTGVRSDSVKRTVENLANVGTITTTQIVETSKQPNGGVKMITNHYVNERDSYVVCARLSPEFTAKLVDFWLEYKSKGNTPKLPQNYIEALEYLVVSEKEKQIALEQVKVLEVSNDKKRDKLLEQQPLIDMCDQFFDSNKYMSLSEYAKTIYNVTKMGRNKLIDDLRKRDIFLKGSPLPHQKYINNDCFKIVHSENGYISAKLSRKGVKFLNSIYFNIGTKGFTIMDYIENGDI